MDDRIPVFLSVGEPHTDAQQRYLDSLCERLASHGVEARTLGRSLWSIQKPLRPIQQMMQEVYGAVILAMERFHSLQGVYREGCPRCESVTDQYFATIWTHIEGAMAYQLELPLLILRDKRIAVEGMFDAGIHEWVVVRVNADDPEELTRNPVLGFVESWVRAVRRCYYTRSG